MLLYWKIRFLDSRDRSFKDRELWLATEALDPLTKAAIEAVVALRDTGRQREILRYRGLFQEKKYATEELNALHTRHSDFRMVFIETYFEDEDGKELSGNDMARIQSGDPNAIGFLPGMMVHQHDIAYALAEARPVVVDQITLTQDHLRILGYFTRDLRELERSAFMRDGPGTFSCGGSHTAVKTAASDEEIRSFVTIFRRLYMENEEANFSKAVDVFCSAVPGLPITNWVRGTADLYKSELGQKPDPFPIDSRDNWVFTRKRLIDVFIYTQYAHQPREDRSRQLAECLASVAGDRELFLYLFLTEIWHCSIHMLNAGAIITGTYDRYCLSHGINPDISKTIRDLHVGLGALEKKMEIEKRVLNEKADDLANAMWENSGRPQGGPGQFLGIAVEQLKVALAVQ